LGEARVEKTDCEGMEAVRDWCEWKQIIGGQQGENVEDQFVGEFVKVAAI
jgi:hypothetical protein